MRVGTCAAGECFHSFFEFSQTFMSVSITQQKHGELVSYKFLLENTTTNQGVHFLRTVV